MKRSDAIETIKWCMENNHPINGNKDRTSVAKEILGALEEIGMLPPTIPAKDTKSVDFPWGYGCTMKCNCDQCNPEYQISKWEKE